MEISQESHWKSTKFFSSAVHAGTGVEVHTVSILSFVGLIPIIRVHVVETNHTEGFCQPCIDAYFIDDSSFDFQTCLARSAIHRKFSIKNWVSQIIQNRMQYLVLGYRALFMDFFGRIAAHYRSYIEAGGWFGSSQSWKMWVLRSKLTSS